VLLLLASPDGLPARPQAHAAVLRGAPPYTLLRLPAALLHAC
jgi:hypothetical protein